MAEMRMCKNEKCVKIVAPSLNPYVERLYCSARCKNAQNQRNYQRRMSGENGDGVLRLDGMVPFMKRTVAPTAKSAEKRFKRHLQHCFLSEDGPCIARTDPYDKQRLCLAKTVLREDWDQLRRAEQGRIWRRELTTIDGMWLADAHKQAQRMNIAAKASPDDDEDEAEDLAGQPQPVRDADPNEEPPEEPEMPSFPALPDRPL